MKIKNIKAENYKTYKTLDLNLDVEEERPIHRFIHEKYNV